MRRTCFCTAVGVSKNDVTFRTRRFVLFAACSSSDCPSVIASKLVMGAGGADPWTLILFRLRITFAFSHGSFPITSSASIAALSLPAASSPPDPVVGPCRSVVPGDAPAAVSLACLAHRSKISISRPYLSVSNVRPCVRISNALDAPPWFIVSRAPRVAACNVVFQFSRCFEPATRPWVRPRACHRFKQIFKWRRDGSRQSLCSK